MENFIIPFFEAVIISLIMTPIVRKLAFKVGAIDIPKDDRRVHNKPMPLMGGVAIYIAIVVSALTLLPIDKSLISIIIGGTIILISGIIDDLKGLSPKMKIVFQLSAGLVLILGDVKVDFITNPFSSESALLYLKWLSIPITLFWVVGITNTLNLIDGLDGLAAGVAMISSLSLMLVASKFGYGNIIILSAIVAGSCLGFLPYNFNPAKIFMGDTGALFLGFMLAAISIEGVMKSVATIAIIVPILILGVPIFDTTFAIFRRLLNGQSIMSADKGHLHHRLLNRGYSQRKTVLTLYGISGIFGLFAVLVAKYNSKQAVYLSVVLFFITVVVAIKMGLFGSKKK
ncbi:undecaprenyl/decaprenyl-phosphate alpha-N-acetylglucosaminyl 1-phosphate transferase [Tissierella sp. MSJ-40]|uniref:Undecaprenyl/decaprenyl-phosphate alpha-N-acetylglucosaminyl 1-phosphate transferase n=1 Tax=Tissierella simiarum TaxID=2841534 RepID=A0ABS6E1F9_9FIRM|nr:MraY family glycosyltransferase [Tissierella simiarum]MBU5436739.1 undecaprenyl/decaprenyl-phosphate alpha-N-acetylglucosaminyl 1-phosphate transferase [Tissierella simiarum]